LPMQTRWAARVAQFCHSAVRRLLRPNIPPAKFAVGQRVRVRLNDRNRTIHEGTIRQIVWHFKDERYDYYLEENGEKVSKRYRDDDLDVVS
jgi:hypothetical protein